MARKQQSRHAPKADARREVKVYGESACAALWERRKEDIIRIYVSPSAKNRWGAALKWCASQRRAYHLVDSEELERVSGSLHHEGVCFLARERRILSERDLEPLLGKDAAQAVIYLDRVDNPHNIGAILRVCAHFSVTAILVPSSQEVSLSGATCRVAEGGAEVVPMVQVSSLPKVIDILRKHHFRFVATSSHVKRSLFSASIAGNTFFFLGAEGTGLSKDLFRLADETVAIPGSGEVESLNVACASSVILAEWWRQNQNRQSSSAPKP